jgi:metal-sulfur cluster biosynthetic enzyme
MYSSEDILQKISHIVDPEIGVSIVDLGLVYETRHDQNGSVYVKMSLTTPACPLGPAIKQQVVETLEQDPAVTGVRFEWTFDPPWTMSRANAETRAILRF